MKVYISLFGHTNSASLPLRMGIALTAKHQQFATLENAEYDEQGSLGQRQSEIDRGNRHYTGTLVVPSEHKELDQPYRFDCRVVLGAPKSSDQSPPVITLLMKSSNRGDMTVTAHIERMLKRGQISTQDLIKYFHPAYVRGEITSSNDCEDIYREHIETITLEAKSADQAGQEILKNPEPILKAMIGNEIEGVDLRSPSKFEKLPISNVRYEYVMADAYIEDVRIENDMIQFKCIDSKGEIRDMHSFKLSPRPYLAHLHQYAFEYLKSRQEQRALFAVCNSDPCKGFFAESVTAISLQLMRTEAAKKMTEQQDVTKH
jgi:hypothetical protein